MCLYVIKGYTYTNPNDGLDYGYPFHLHTQNTHINQWRKGKFTSVNKSLDYNVTNTNDDKIKLRVKNKK